MRRARVKPAYLDYNIRWLGESVIITALSDLLIPCRQAEALDFFYAPAFNFWCAVCEYDPQNFLKGLEPILKNMEKSEPQKSRIRRKMSPKDKKNIKLVRYGKTFIVVDA